MQKVDHFKLGLVTLATIGGVLAISLALALRPNPTDEFHTYFDESVQGLEIGGLVKYRGVRIGTVSDIELAPDRRHVHVTLAIDHGDAEALRIAELATGLRTRLGIIGVTGLKLVDIGLENHPPPEKVLPFPTPRDTIPSMPSLAGKMTEEVEALSKKIPALIDQAVATLHRFETLADDVHRERLAERVGTFLDTAQAAAVDFRRLARRLDPGDGLAQKLDATLASAKRATDSLGQTGRALGGDDLERTLRELRDAARSMRGFFDALERQPDMIMKGRSR